MKYCEKHTCWYGDDGKFCQKCESNHPPHKRDRTEVMNQKEWDRLKKLGWTK